MTKQNGKKILQREIQFKDSDQEYGKVVKMLGNGRLNVQCFDGVKRLAHIRGSLHKSKIETGDILLLSLRDFQDSKCDVIFKYTPEETRSLINTKQIPEELNENNEVEIGGFTFDDI